MQRMKRDAEATGNASTNRHLMEGKRTALDAAASGKSDADVTHLYGAEMKKDTESAGHTVNSTRKHWAKAKG